ncbi:MAG: hypoxanthine phosphoribosyltransferase [Peptococcaceae bacterium]|nr:hypoxanthine phosphoribosyltransferase [Peptococcaceae bacterium]
MHPDGEKILLDRHTIARRVAEMGRQISLDYAGREIVAVGILKGATMFLADLVRAISVPVYLDFVATSSYGSAARSSGEVRILKDLDESIADRHVLLVEDIVDSGLTLNYLCANLSARGPASLRICTLLNKPSRRVVSVGVDYTGFDIPDEFVVGYGLDWAGHHRSLPYIMILRRDVYAGS